MHVDRSSAELEKQWATIDDFLGHHMIAMPPAATIFASHIAQKFNMPPIEITALQGKFLAMLVEMTASTRILELGTLAGYSTAWFASAVPAHGVVHTVESRDERLEVARKTFEHPDLVHKVKLHHGQAQVVMEQLLAQKSALFDFVFIDADKARYACYLELALALTHDKATIILDNTIRQGTFLKKNQERKISVQGLQKLYAAIKNNQAIEVTSLQTVGAKGWDGFMMVRKK